MSLADNKQRESNGPYDNSRHPYILYFDDVKETIKKIMSLGNEDQLDEEVLERIKFECGEELINSPYQPEAEAGVGILPASVDVDIPQTDSSAATGDARKGCGKVLKEGFRDETRCGENTELCIDCQIKVDEQRGDEN